MRISSQPPLHLTYCLNIHPGETWAENFAAIRTHAMRVRDAVARQEAFGLGLRLSGRAANELADPARLAEFRDFLAANALYVFTINGFPYGRFHGTAVKEDVYRPDWRTPERRDYTMRLIDILAALLPEGVGGSVSTVPGAYGPWIRDERDVRRMSRMMAEVAAHAAAVRDRTGHDVCVALEPEPDCFLEKTDQAIEFLTETLPRDAVAVLAERRGVSAAQAAAILARHVGVCLDTAHAAVQFEDPAEAIRKLTSRGVRVGKVQLSAALRLRPTSDSLERLRRFADPVYLHQVRATRGGQGLLGFRDLPEALAAVSPRLADSPEARVHFHVPLFFTQGGGLESTAPLLDEAFWRLLTDPAEHPTEQLEIETYTFEVLPDELRADDVAQSIQREYQWVLARAAAASGR
jgi:sugar phosphate isomerase/epimerase